MDIHENLLSFGGKVLNKGYFIKEFTGYPYQFFLFIFAMERKDCLEQLVSRMNNGLIKVVTGIRRCGKSYLVFSLFKQYLLEQLHVSQEHIVTLALDDDACAAYRNPLHLSKYLRERIASPHDQYYILIDEIQYCYRVKRDDVDEKQVAPEDRDSLYISFYDVLNGIQRLGNVDIYVTGSNSKMLANDIKTIFRGRSDEIRLHPFSFSEYHAYIQGDKSDDWENYMTYGGMPLAVFERDETKRRNYLVGLYSEVYLKDLVERNRIQEPMLLEAIIDVLNSAVGSLTNPSKLANTISSTMNIRTTSNTVDVYIEYLRQAFLFGKAKRFDVKGKKYFETPYKLYSEDIGLRNARLNWRQQERPHIMENILYNELVRRGLSVDVGVVAIDSRKNGKREVRSHEIDFIVNQGFNKTYIQSAFAMDSQEKREQELLPLRQCKDFFRKIVVTGGNEKLWQDEEGILHIGIIPFLLDGKILS